ncbi:VOC family protein [Paraglaciecola sp. 20A4]|uniref:VOC family protein n=1 Tax=Paraglaciecola sp. 20A4 TaxID=2687288 RepID=UPI00140D9247|nr:VOC family protein [Paraglaciecola sp. 20A4]
MQQSVCNVTLLVDDYDKGVEFYTQTLDFNLLDDIKNGPNSRWVRVAPNHKLGQAGAALVLMKAEANQQPWVGNQTAGSVAFFLQTDNFQRDYENMLQKGVTFLEQPRDEPYATVVIFQDCFGNKWDLLQSK